MTMDFNDAGPQKGVHREDPRARKERIRSGLRDRLREFVRYLHPHAEISEHEARIGDVRGAEGSSLSIALTGARCGQWFDHSTGEGGDEFSFAGGAWGLEPSRDLPRILAECEAWLGGKPTARANARHNCESAGPTKPKPSKTLECIYRYLASDGSPTGFEVHRFRTTDGGKTFSQRWQGEWTAPQSNRPLYGQDRWHAANAVVFVEGEKCADALQSIGVPATTIAGGSSVRDFDKFDFSPLRGKQITLWPDNDQVGTKFMNALATYLRADGHHVLALDPPAGKPDKWDAADAVAEGFDVRTYIGQAASSTGGGILYELWPEIEYRYEPELVEDLFPQVGVATAYGRSTAGKTFGVLDWVASIATGRQLFDRDTTPVGVLYLAFEGYRGIKKRIHGIKQEKGLHMVALELVDAPWTLSEPEDWQGLCTHIEAAKVRLDEAGYPLGIIVIDTLTAAYAGVDANSQAEITKAMKQLKRLAVGQACLVLTIGHTGKDTTKGMAGSFAYKSESDTFIQFHADTNDDTGEVVKRTVRVEKVKDGASDYVLSEYRLKEVVVGTKPNGKPITTCVVEWIAPGRSGTSDAAAEQAQREATERRDALRRQVLDGIARNLGDGWMPTRETADRLKDAGLPISRKDLIDVLKTFASERADDLTQIVHAGVTIEVRTRRSDNRTTLHFRVNGNA